MAASGERTDRVHAGRFSSKQRLHLAAVLIALAIASPLAAQSEIEFDYGITQAEFAKFSRLVAQGIYATPVEPARAGSVLGFSIGVAATALPVDTDASYWQRAVSEDFTVSDHVAVPRLVVTKGLGALSISGTYAKVPDTSASMIGGAIDVPIINGGLVKPTLALRGAYSQLSGFDEFDLKTYGLELFLGKGFGPLTPYGAVGIARSDARGRLSNVPPNVLVTDLTDEAESRRLTLGLRLSLFIPKIVIEATQGEERSYAAKVAFGL